MKNTKSPKKQKSSLFPILIFAVLAIAFIYVARGGFGLLDGNDKSAASGSDLVIPKSDITQTVKFFPVKAGKTKMEIMAVKASDGTIRTAFNTCQVCNGSPRAYYKQQGDVVVCQNCGNKFRMDMIEQQRGGCNPVPISKEDKTEDGTNIVIPWTYIEANSDLFTDNWKTQ